MTAVARLSHEDHMTALAANMPGGRAWIPKLKVGSNLRGFMTGFAGMFLVMDQSLQRFIDQSVPPETTDFIDEWETALGIPDECFKAETDIVLRRRNVNTKLAIMAGIATEQDYIDLGALFGLEIAANAGIDHLIVGDGGTGTKLPALDINGPNSDFADIQEARFTLVIVEAFPEAITFPWEFPLLFATSGQNSLRCIIGKLKPANTEVLFLEKP